MDNFTIWFTYILFAVLALLCKLAAYLKNSASFGKSWKESLREWFFERTVDNSVSWLATVVIVWVLGYLYIEQVVDFTGVVGKVVDKIPLCIPVAALFGVMAEMMAPALTKWVVGKVMKELEAPK